MTDKPLTAKEDRFVEAYVGPSMGNGTDACRRAGYVGTDKTLATQASRLLSRPQVKAALKQRREMIFAETTRRVAEETAEEGRQKAEAILSALDCAVLLSGMATGAIGEPQPEGGEAPPKHTTRIKAIEVLAKLRGYDKPTLVTDSEGAPTVSPDMERALIRLAQLSPEQWAAFQAGVSTGG